MWLLHSSLAIQQTFVGSFFRRFVCRSVQMVRRQMELILFFYGKEKQQKKSARQKESWHWLDFSSPHDAPMMG